MALLLWTTLAMQPAAPATALPWTAGRVYTSASLHVGVRPAVYFDGSDGALGVTVQVSATWP